MYRTIVHLHLHKTGGTSLNRWLDTLVPAVRARPAERRLDIESGDPLAASLIGDRARQWASTRMHLQAACPPAACPHTCPPPQPMRQFVLFSERGRDARAYWDVIHDHCPAVVKPDPSAYHVVVLRDPLDRFLSFVRDWRRLTESDLSVLPPAALALRRAALDSGADGVVRCAVETGLLASFMQCTSLAAAAIYGLPDDVLADCGPDPFALATRALDSLFQLVGVAERLDDVARCIARDVGVCPLDSLGRSNQGVADPDRDTLSAGSRAILEDAFAIDRELHRRAAAMLQARLEPGYCEAEFEARHLERRLERLTPRFTAGRREFSLNDAIVGCGFHGREAADTDQVTVWTGPGTRTVLYLPVPADERLLVSLDIGGVIQPAVGASLHIRVDGRIRDFQRLACSGGIERIVVPVRTNRPFCKLELLVDRTLTPAEAGWGGIDGRRLGIALRGYGYQLEPTQGLVLRDTAATPARGREFGLETGEATTASPTDRAWVELIAQEWLDSLATEGDPDRLVEIVAWDVSAAELAAAPTAAGVERAFRRIHMGPAPPAWLDFWVGRPDTTLRHLYRDLVSGGEFRQRLDRFRSASR